MINIEEQYWDERYANDGTSGEGSIGGNRDWKWSVVERFVPFYTSVLDVGCGDLSFWEGRECEDYTGIDISKTIIENNIKRRPKWKFICINSEKRINGLKKEVVLCLDVLFHIMDSKIFIKTLYNICYYSKNYIFIHTWKNNPFNKRYKIKQFLHYLVNLKIISAINELKKLLKKSNKTTNGDYQYFRSLDDYLYIFKEQGFKLQKIKENPNKIGALYIFAREDKYSIN